MTRMSAFRTISVGAMLMVSTSALSQAPALTFGLIGDLGYRPAEEPLLQNVLDDLNNNALAFVVHVVDLSSPPYACTDDLVARRFAQFSASAHPFIYTPGANEWTDCHERQGVKGGKPLERLAHVRKVFFAGEQSLGQRTMPWFTKARARTPCFRNTARMSVGPLAA